ncbi:DUF2628 domain-containing protein [Tsukamurella spumae]|uniref:DUF2628 domain-containing protein n=1 Tax=Tsukamurella spumae TaxID=44753 RepID=UPI0028ADDE83|nr:DUF2628 domain-containing protein [Tsukamurella spumae]
MTENSVPPQHPHDPAAAAQPYPGQQQPYPGAQQPFAGQPQFPGQQQPAPTPGFGPDGAVPERWRSRFEFFGRYGQPASSPEATAAFKALPFGTRFRLGFNGPAFFFGPIYYAIKGPWRKGLSLLGGVVVLSVIVGIIEFALGITIPSGAFGAAVGVIYSTTANWAYFLHVTRGSTSWNPFEGMPMVRKKA